MTMLPPVLRQSVHLMFESPHGLFRVCCTDVRCLTLLLLLACVACNTSASNQTATSNERDEGGASPQDASASEPRSDAGVAPASSGAGSQSPDANRDASPESTGASNSGAEPSAHSSSAAMPSATSTNDSPFTCSYAELMRHYRASSLAAGGRCVDARFDLSEGATVESRPCKDSDPQHFRLVIQEDCSYVLELQWGQTPYTYEWCLGSVDTNVTLTACARASRFVLRELTDSSYQLEAPNGLCLHLSNIDGEPAALTECGEAASFTLGVAPAPVQAVPASAEPRVVEVSPTNGGGLHIDDPIEASGLGIRITDERTRWVDIREEFTARFAFRIQWDSDYLLSFLAATGFDDAAVEVTLDDEYAGTATLRKTKELNDYQRSRALNLRLSGLDHRLGLSNVGDKPFGLADVILWPVNGRLPDFGSVHPVSSSTTTTLSTAAISDMYRSRLDDDGTEPHWSCDWTFCFVEYDVTVEQSGSYDFAVQFRTYDQFTGALLFVNGIQVGDIPFAVVAEGDPFTWSTPIAVEFEQGRNTVRLQHGDYLYEGMLSGQYAIKNPRLQGAN